MLYCDILCGATCVNRAVVVSKSLIFAHFSHLPQQFRQHAPLRSTTADQHRGIFPNTAVSYDTYSVTTRVFAPCCWVDGIERSQRVPTVSDFVLARDRCRHSTNPFTISKILSPSSTCIIDSLHIHPSSRLPPNVEWCLVPQWYQETKAAGFTTLLIICAHPL